MGHDRVLELFSHLFLQFSHHGELLVHLSLLLLLAVYFKLVKLELHEFLFIIQLFNLLTNLLDVLLHFLGIA